MIAARQEKDVYRSSFALFEKGLDESGRSPLRRLRRRALQRFADLGFPTLKDEEWRFTNLAPLAKIAFELGELEDADLLEAPVQLLPAGIPGTVLQFVNARPPMLRHQGAALPDGLLVCSLAEALAEHRDLVEPHLARYADYEGHAFTALNTAFLRDGAFVYIPGGKRVAEPICLAFHAGASSKPIVWQRRCLIVAGPGSQARVVESYDGAEGRYFTNAVTEVVAAENAVLDHYRLQRESREAFHIATVQVRQDRGSNFTCHSLTEGGSLSRTDLNVVLDAEGCECILNGLYLADGNQLVDNHTRIDHARPRCTSHELYKGILAGRAHGVFNGKIVVHKDAQKTDARQTNKTLLLSDDAAINTKPQLEIYADDVKCTHGASIGQLDEEAIFYLRTRGIGREAARQLLTYAFANEVIQRIQIDPLRAQLEEALRSPQLLPGEQVEEVP